MIRTILLACAAAALLAVPPASAQSRREMSERIDALELSLVRMEQRFLAGDPVAETLLERMDALEYEVRAQTSELERLAFENRRLRAELEAMGADVESLLALTRADPPADAAGLRDYFAPSSIAPVDGETGEMDSDVESEGAVDPADPYAAQRAAATGALGAGVVEMRTEDAATLFNTAQARMRDSDYAGARESYAAFVQNYPGDRLAGEAFYWLGETYYLESSFSDAADAFIASLRNEPDGEKAPEALVRLAASLAGMGQVREACDALSRFDRQFPNASDAARARAARESARAGCA